MLPGPPPGRAEGPTRAFENRFSEKSHCPFRSRVDGLPRRGKATTRPPRPVAKPVPASPRTATITNVLRPIMSAVSIESTKSGGGSAGIPHSDLVRLSAACCASLFPTTTAGGVRLSRALRPGNGRKSSWSRAVAARGDVLPHVRSWRRRLRAFLTARGLLPEPFTPAGSGCLYVQQRFFGYPVNSHRRHWELWLGQSGVGICRRAKTAPAPKSNRVCWLANVAQDDEACADWPSLGLLAGASSRRPTNIQGGRRNDERVWQP